MKLVPLVLVCLVCMGHGHARRVQIADKNFQLDSQVVKAEDAAGGILFAHKRMLAKLIFAFDPEYAFRSSSLEVAGNSFKKGMRSLDHPQHYHDVRMNDGIPERGGGGRGRLLEIPGRGAPVVEEIPARGAPVVEEIPGRGAPVVEEIPGRGAPVVEGRGAPVVEERKIPLEELAVGADVEGKIESVGDYAAFVDVGAEVPAFLHKSDIAGDFVANVSEALNVGEVMKGRIKRIDLIERNLAITCREDITPIEDLVVGGEVEGKVTAVFPYGAFVNIGSVVNALLHKSDLSDEYIEDATTKVEVGQILKGRLKSIDLSTEKLSMTCKGSAADKTPLEELRVGKRARGKVTQVLDYGAFVDIGATKNALLHKSDISTDFVDDATRKYKVGDLVEGRIKTINLSKQTIGMTCV